MFKWLKDLLSGSRSASYRRFISLQSFYFIVYFSIVGSLGTNNLSTEKINFLMQIENHFFWLVALGFGFTTATSLAEIIKSNIPQPPVNNFPNDTIYDNNVL